jgi:Mn2+/Fe2+ NRAMP family transporter
MLQRKRAGGLESRFATEAIVAELSEPPRLPKLIGPGVILLATAVGSGEILFWPGITTTYGFQFVWLIAAALLFQYVLNTEFERYTLATGEAVVSGYVRISPAFRYVFLAAAILPWVWPGWATGGAQAIQWLFGGEVRWIASATLVTIGLLLTSSRLVYRAVEAAQTWMVAYILIVLILAAALVVRPDVLLQAAGGLTQSPLPLPEGLATSTLLAALVFCGAGGTINLAASNWVRDKGFGLGALAPKIVNPLTGASEASGGGVYRFEASESNIRRWRIWWRLARREQQITFLLGSMLGLALPMLIAFALLGRGELGVGTDAVRAQANLLGGLEGGWARVAFILAVAAIFLTSALGVLDHAARLAASLLVGGGAESRQGRSRWRSESGVYFLVLWAMIAFGLIVLLGLDVADPPALLTLAGALSGIVMFVYSGLTLWLNVKMRHAFDRLDPRFGNDNPFRMSPLRILAVAAATLLFGILSFAVIQDAAAKAFG